MPEIHKIDLMSGITIDDGTREVPILNKFGQMICKIHFRPADLSLFDRYKNLADDFARIIAPLAEINIGNDGSASTESDWAVLKSVEANLKNRLNLLLDSDDADLIFEKRNPFSSVGGEFFCAKVLAAIGSIIKAAFDEEATMSNERVGKYLSDLEESHAGETSDKSAG